jgi:hypothetical protein
MMKFLNSIKVWTFKYCEPIGPTDYIASFVSHELKIILNCVSSSQLIEPPSPTSSISFEHTLDKELLQNNCGYSVIDIKTLDFLSLNYNERVQHLRT